jgi:hypothetical protein
VRDDKSNCLVWALMDRVQGPAASVIVCTGFLSIGKRCDRAWAVSLYMAIVAIIEGVGVCVYVCQSADGSDMLQELENKSQMLS